jgi:hypothetical protein
LFSLMMNWHNGSTSFFVILSAAKESVFYYETAYSDSFAALRMTKNAKISKNTEGPPFIIFYQKIQILPLFLT